MEERLERFHYAENLRETFSCLDKNLGVELSTEMCNLEAGWWLNPRDKARGQQKGLDLCQKLSDVLRNGLEKHICSTGSSVLKASTWPLHYWYGKDINRYNVSAFIAVTRALQHIASLSPRKDARTENYLTHSMSSIQKLTEMGWIVSYIESRFQIY